MHLHRLAAAVFLLIAKLALAQCATGVTDGAQNLCGVKTLSSGAIIGENSGAYPGLVVRGGGVWLDGPYSFVQVPDGAGRPVYFRDDVPSGSEAGSFIFEARRHRLLTDPIMVVRRKEENGATSVIFSLLANGTINTGTIVTSGNSGAASLQASGNYVTLSADFPPHYQGEHGALSVSSKHPCHAYNLIQAGNGRSDAGARTDYAFNVSCRGGIYSRDLLNGSELPVCNGGLPEPPDPNNRTAACPDLAEDLGGYGPQVDGGYCFNWTTMHGPAMAKAGETFGFVLDVGEGCQCVPSKWDGGASPAGWFKLSDRSECRP